MAWTRFMDMHSGGGCKESPYEYIYIEAPEDEAKVIFYNRFGHSPDRVTCTCCGSDYSVDTEGSLAAASWYDRGAEVPKAGEPFSDSPHKPDRCGSTEYVSLADYVKRPDVLIIPADQIQPEQRLGQVPVEGYVWV